LALSLLGRRRFDGLHVFAVEDDHDRITAANRGQRQAAIVARARAAPDEFPLGLAGPELVLGVVHFECDRLGVLVFGNRPFERGHRRFVFHVVLRFVFLGVFFLILLGVFVLLVVL